ncbi:MAG: hypothetical protein MZW92_37180 [Comamonadaceae bacterium]|nr:hypothetical protein [Comamonadaceae bacterium]
MALMFLERAGKAMRVPPRDAMLSFAGHAHGAWLGLRPARGHGPDRRHRWDRSIVAGVLCVPPATTAPRFAMLAGACPAVAGGAADGARSLLSPPARPGVQ